MQTVLNVFVFVGSAMALGVLLTRMDPVTWGNTRAAVVVFHWALIVSSGGVLVSALRLHAGLEDCATLVAVGAWLHISMPTWASGQIPVHFQTRPGDLGPPETPKGHNHA
jgi:hypothetical protein